MFRDDRPHYYENKPAVKPLRDLPDWGVGEGEPDFRGWRVIDKNGNDIGAVDDMFVDTQKSEAVFASIHHPAPGGSGMRTTLIPLDMVDIDRDYRLVKFQGYSDYIQSAPPYSVGTNDFSPYYDYWSRTRYQPQEQPQGQPVGQERVERERVEPVGSTQPPPTETRAASRKPIVLIVRRNTEPTRHGVDQGEDVLHEGEVLEVEPIDEEDIEHTRRGY